MLLSRDAITAAVEAHVEASDYYKPAHVHIHEAVMALYGQGEPVDPVTIAEELRRAELATPSVGAPRCCASRRRRRHRRTPATTRIVNELALLRRLIGVAGDIAEMGYDTPEDVAETLDRAESMVFEVAERRVSESLASISDSLQTTLDQLESMYGSDNEVVGVPSGYHELDSLLLGLQRSNLVIVATPLDGQVRRVGHTDRRCVDGLGADRPGGLRARAGRPPVRARARRRPARRSIAPSAFVDDGVKPVYKITTRTGRVVRTTITHPFLTADGWKPHRHLRRRPSPCLVRSECSETNRAPKRGRHARVPHRERLSRRRLAGDEHRVALGAPGVAAMRRQARCHGQAPPRPSTASARRWGGRARSPPCCASGTFSGRRSRGPSTS